LIGDNLNGMAVFARVVEAKSFSGAALTLGLSKSAVSKQISQLEDRLGARLLDRTTRRVALTEVGRVFYDHAARMLIEAESAEAAVASLHELPRGVLRINLPVTFGLTHIAPLIPGFLEQCPELKVEMTFSDRYVDLLEEGFDLAVRIARLTDSSLVARRLAPNRLAMCASPDYIARHGEPKAPSDLGTHACLTYSYSPDPEHWMLSVDGKLTDVKIGGRLRANNGDALRLAAIGNQGLVVLPTFMVGDDLRAGRLVEVMRGATPVDSAIYAVYPSRRYLTPKVRAFIDFLIDQFGPEPYWDRA
jgi:DNA-binding transcriptional LysR family regulator